MHSEEFDLENEDADANGVEEDKVESDNEGQIRVKMEIVENIVGEVATSTTGASQTKRRLPPWMQGAESTNTNDEEQECQTSKRCRTDQNEHSEEPVCSSSVLSAPLVPEEREDAGISAAEQHPSPCYPIADAAPSAASSSSVVEIKQEPPELPQTSSSTGTSNPANVKPAVKVELADATSSTPSSRDSCKFGIRCYRRNPMHRIEEAHPGDDDYKRPSFPAPPTGTPDCPFGNSCYRRNPNHFQQYNHPADTDFAQNYKNYRMRLRQRQQQPNADANDTAGSDLDEYDLNDPFIDDAESDVDYVPNDDDEEEDDDDDGDKVEE